MEEVKGDKKQSSTREFKQSQSGWIRLHSDESIESPPSNETPVEKMESQNRKESRTTNRFLENGGESKNPESE